METSRNPKDGKRRIFGRCNLPAHALSVVVVLFTGLLALHDASADALTTAARSPIVALGIDASHHVLLKATVDALYRSVDDGRHWNRIALPQTHGRVLAIATSARRPGLLYVGGPGLGVLRSDNDGQSWQSTNADCPAVPSRPLPRMPIRPIRFTPMWPGVEFSGARRTDGIGA